MGYLDNTSITVDAILTRRGRELLSRNDGSFQITQFALGDDEIDYTLYNENHPDGSQYFGEAIENLPLVEAFPDENNIMIHKLATLPRGTTKLPILQVGSSKINLGLGQQSSVSPQTFNFAGVNNVVETNGYLAVIADRRLLSSFVGTGTNSTGVGTIPFTGERLSQTVRGQSFTLTAINSTTLFGANDTLTTTITLTGLDSGAKTTIPITISKTVTSTSFTGAKEFVQTL
jgi:hypothetical protein|tara:strand:+ start:114 stop:806 length:693 start_codon:yes stop_codon:yes gene_type:complete